VSNEPEILLETRRFRVRRQTLRGANGKETTRETVEHPGSATILPLVDDDHVCLIRNQRPSVAQTLIELPAGTLEAGEEPLVCAYRELEEETGYRAKHIEPLCGFFPSPGILNERMHLFVATGLELHEQNLDDGERIENLIVRWSEALEMARDGRIQDGKTLVGLLYYDLFRRGRG
jgi:ADP-ribose pyrophosphatase